MDTLAISSMVVEKVIPLCKPSTTGRDQVTVAFPSRADARCVGSRRCAQPPGRSERLRWTSPASRAVDDVVAAGIWKQAPFRSGNVSSDVPPAGARPGRPPVNGRPEDRFRAAAPRVRRYRSPPLRTVRHIVAQTGRRWPQLSSA